MWVCVFVNSSLLLVGITFPRNIRTLTTTHTHIALLLNCLYLSDFSGYSVRHQVEHLPSVIVIACSVNTDVE